jgi:hypothetical protein
MEFCYALSETMFTEGHRLNREITLALAGDVQDGVGLV